MVLDLGLGWFTVGYKLNITPVDIGACTLRNFAAVVPGSGFRGLKQKDFMSGILMGYWGCLVAGVGVVVVLLVWYLLSGKREVSVLEEVDIGDWPELMGEAKLDEGVSIVSSSELGFVALLLAEGDLPVLEGEIRELCRLLSEKDGNKEEFISLLRLTVENRPKIPAEFYGRLSGFVRENAGFFLSDVELEGLWL